MRIPQLDGLRALAVLLVLLIHHGLLPAGWVGVDIFFVLSGFLITGILRKDRDATHYWRTFYTKRAARILPPLCLLLAVAFSFSGYTGLGALGYLFFLGNFVQLTGFRIAVLSSLWSLAIEEHFYLLWPSAVKRLSRTRLLQGAVAIVALSPFVRAAGTLALRHWFGPLHGWDNPIFLLTFFRLDGLAAGAALALLLEGDRKPVFLARWSGYASLAAYGMFLGLEAAFPSFRRTTDNLAFNCVGYSLVVIASFSLVSYLLLRPKSFLARGLSLKPVVFLGSISYGVYLYSEAVIFGMRSIVGMHTPLPWLFVPDLLLTGAFAAASFYWIEKPVMAWSRTLLKAPGPHRSRPKAEAAQPSSFIATAEAPPVSD